MTFAQGQAIGAYEIMERIGQGGMATVYRAYQPEMDRHVAVKILHHTYLTDAVLRARFEREAQIVRGLSHPNILPVYDYDEHNDQPYLVMKLVENRSLKSILLDGSLELERIFAVLEPIASALDYAHSQGVLHRDIKPSNILFDTSGTPYLTDFGLARFVAAGESSLSRDIFIGTPFYVSPEQGGGEKNITTRSDLYSFGVVMYELLVGQVPYNAGSTFAVIHDHIYKPLPLPSLFNPNLPPNVESILLKALSKRPEERYASASEMIDMLRGAVKHARLTQLKIKQQIPPGFPGAETPVMNKIPRSDTSLLPRTDSRAQAGKRPRRLWVIAGVVLLLVLVAGGFFLLNRPSVPAPPPSFSLYTVPISDLDTARANAAANPANPSAQLAYLRAVLLSPNYEASEQFATAERIIANALPDVDEPIRFLWTAADVARSLQKTTEAFALYAEALVYGMETELFDPLRYAAGEYMYNLARDPDALDPLQIRRWNSNSHYESSPLVMALLARALITDNRLLVAEIALERPNVRDSAMPEIRLITGELREAEGNPARARVEYDLAKNVPDAPTWVQSRADELMRALN